MGKIAPRKKSCYCINFRRSANTLTKYYDKAFAEINLSVNQFSLLNDISILKLCNKSQLAQFARLDRTTVIRSLNVLIDKKLVEEVEDDNNRKIGVQLTQLGKDSIVKGFEIWKETQFQITSIIGEKNIEVLKQIIDAIELLDSEI